MSEATILIDSVNKLFTDRYFQLFIFSMSFIKIMQGLGMVGKGFMYIWAFFKGRKNKFKDF